MGFLDNAKSLFSRLNPFNRINGKKVVQELIKHPIKLRSEINNHRVKDGTICYFEYDPKNKNDICDYKPLIIILGLSKNYMLGCNFHWINMNERLELIKFIIKLNTENGKINKPLQFTYKELKRFLMQPQYKQCLRLYIIKRMSLKGVIVDPKYLLDIARLKLEHFL